MFHKNMELLRSNFWLHDLPGPILSELASISYRRTFDGGQLIVAKNEPIEGIYIVINGAIRDSTTSEDGREIVFFSVPTGGIWGIVAALDNEGAVHEARAYGRTETLTVSTPALHHLLDNEPLLYRRFARMLCYRLRKAYEAIDELGLAPLLQRIARQLYTLGTLAGSAQKPAMDSLIYVTQEELATRVGATRSSVNRELRQLQDDDILELGYGTIKILDYERLYALCPTSRIFNR